MNKKIIALILVILAVAVAYSSNLQKLIYPKEVNYVKFSSLTPDEATYPWQLADFHPYYERVYPPTGRWTQVYDLASFLGGSRYVTTMDIYFVVEPRSSATMQISVCYGRKDTYGVPILVRKQVQVSFTSSESFSGIVHKKVTLNAYGRYIMIEMIPYIIGETPEKFEAYGKIYYETALEEARIISGEYTDVLYAGMTNEVCSVNVKNTGVNDTYAYVALYDLSERERLIEIKSAFLKSLENTTFTFEMYVPEERVGDTYTFGIKVVAGSPDLLRNVTYFKIWNATVSSNLPPVADFDYEINGLTVHFYDKSHDPDGYITAWQWWLGDGSVSYEQNPVHTYRESLAGEILSVVLTVTDNEGATNTVYKYITLPSVSQKTYYLTVDVSPSNAGYVIINPQTDNLSYPEGSEVILDAVAYEGYVFSHWEGDVNGSSTPITITMDSNKTITAVFSTIQPSKFTLNVTVNIPDAGWVDVSPVGGIYDYGTVVTLTAHTKEGYRFSHWGGDASGTSETITIVMDSNKNVVAYFEKETGYATPWYAGFAILVIIGLGYVMRRK